MVSSATQTHLYADFTFKSTQKNRVKYLLSMVLLPHAASNTEHTDCSQVLPRIRALKYQSRDPYHLLSFPAHAELRQQIWTCATGKSFVFYNSDMFSPFLKRIKVSYLSENIFDNK